MQRRRYLALTGIGTLSALSGCAAGDTDENAGSGDTGNNDNNDGTANTGGSGGSGGTDTTTPTDTPTPTATPTATATATPTPTPTPSPDVTILEDELNVGDYGTVSVVGKFKNTSGKEQSYIQVSAKFFNGKDERVGEGMDNATDVPDGQVVNFEILTMAKAEEIDHYELEASTSAF